jgi:ABC-type multidrug transport system permease subunit
MMSTDYKPPHPVFALTRARLIEFIRRPEALFWVYGFPLVMVVILGVAFRNRPVETIDVDVATGPLAVQIVDALRPDERIKVHEFPLEQSRNRLRTGKTAVMVTASGSQFSTIEYHFDPQRPGSTEARNLIENRLQISAGRKDVFASSDVEFAEQGGRYVDFLVPGLLGMSIMGGGLWGVGFAIVDLRIRKLLKRFMATPMRRSHFLLAMMISRIIFMIPQIVILLLFSYLIFGVRVYGSFPAAMFVILLGAFEFAAIGLLVGSRAQTLETASGLMNLVMLPMWTLSGIFFSYERFPEVVHPFIRCLPLTPVIDALRGIMLDAKPLTAVSYELGIVMIWGFATFMIALSIFRWND